MLSSITRLGVVFAAGGLAVAAAGAAHAATPPAPSTCEGLAAAMAGRWPDATTRLVSATPREAGARPAHCEVFAVLRERRGANGQAYAIRMHVRLPEAWNHRLLFQGGGGSDGVVGDAFGHVPFSAREALSEGFAVVSQDSGHDNATNNDPARGGVLAFGFDAEARADYGQASLAPVARAAEALTAARYGETPKWSYFVGCSKGGQEGLALAERNPDLFDGILAGAPGMSLPRAAIAEAWDTQTFARAGGAPGTSVVTALPAALSAADLALARAAILRACDELDGLRDGVIADFAHCTTARVMPELLKIRCRSEKTDVCLDQARIAALLRSNGGPRDSRGRSLYVDWPWDTGIASPGWRAWKLGTPERPALNLLLGAGSLAAVFTTPPTALKADPDSLAAFIMAFDFDRGASRIHDTAPGFPRSAWDDISARSPDLRAFAAHGGKLIVPHGVSDPVFSIHDTLAWLGEADRLSAGHAADFVRVFPTPGMTHCGGGESTDMFDALAPLMDWVEHGRPPSQIVATAGAATPWPGRTRPLCAYPDVAVFKGSGDVEKASSFACRRSLVARRHA